ncbi:hypothetical protein PIGHUM_03491 [Pigmentiphaga humi]|uniref:L-ornithine N(alpha)-acyltransferase n=1 Tax=Pigmentiphaga humi TaxID=2478468 RepID=A0A3P4B538_9BURK|nr:GNAT family N-acyltransferase [Pigmentiphaga humi]VCU71407.1 hypothetical protein PIGHUM_03491 [Pigmentiphaga humi]
MLEFTRIEAPRSPASGLDDGPVLAVGLARSWEEVRQAQRLRYEVFTEDMGAVFPGAVGGIDEDRFDAWCEHLIVRELDTDRVVGTYRILAPEQARLAGGYYSESEFDLSGLAPIRSELVEFGRSCTHRDYRSGSVIMLLWSGLAEFLRRSGHRYVFGCASVSLRDDGATAAGVYRSVASHIESARELRVTPLHGLPMERLDCRLPVRVPPLIKGYLKTGARVCGEPAWDADFNTADFPMLLSMDALDDRYRRHFGLDTHTSRQS